MNRSLEKHLTDVLGLSDRRLKELTIKCRAGEPTEVHTVEFIINPNVGIGLVERTFKLEEIKSEVVESYRLIKEK